MSSLLDSYNILHKMLGKGNKAGLLLKHGSSNQEEWIEMSDYCQFDSSSKNKVPKHQYNYQKIESIRDLPYNPYADQSQKYQPTLQEPYDPTIVKMNGDTFKMITKEKNQVKKESKLPKMHVQCCYCLSVQTIPGTSTMFRCGSCSMMNDCTPAFQLIKCKSCQVKVLFTTGISLQIKCTRCQTINSVEPYFPQNPYAHHNEFGMDKQLLSEEISEDANLYPGL